MISRVCRFVLLDCYLISVKGDKTVVAEIRVIYKYLVTRL